MPYQPIEDYGVIGNMRTAALISARGSIDWLCFPRFDSPSVFAALLDDEKGGRFSVHPVRDSVKYKQLYWPDTNVLVTRFLSHDGVAEVEDFMPAGIAGYPEWHDRIVRRVRVVRGSVPLEVVCEPAFDYAQSRHVVSLYAKGAVFDSRRFSLSLATRLPLEPTERGVRGRFELNEGQHATLVLSQTAPGICVCPPPSEAEAEELFEATVSFWRHWLSHSTYRGRWRETVHRSALTLKLLTYEPTGAIIAAPTCSLPERIGGPRNWDYRYAWIRDAAFTIYALLRIGFREEAMGFMDFLEARAEAEALRPGDEQPLQIVYGIDGRCELEERTL
ncbi:MAG: glycoside hydrolase family 15 protein, partial [Polyangiaceae bacterium]|nr:glycoside hydrolase family 15 protein [Polyangiaceae bacterium]